MANNFENLLPSSTRRLTAKDFQTELAKLADEMRVSIEASVSGFAPGEAAKAARIKKVLDKKNGFQFFATTYFPHYLTKKPSLLHEHLFSRLPAVVGREKGAHDIVVAPRGAAKSTLVSLIFPIWASLTGLTHYTIIVMDAYAQAALALEAIKAELESNPRLAMDFPKFTGKGRIWREGEIVLKNSVRIEGVGAGQKLRGRRHGPFRPDLVVLDDIENDENVRSPEQRDKLETWLLRAVLKLGAADGSMNLFYIGTVLHHDAVILRMARKPGWHLARFKALMQMPNNMTKWETWEEILRNDGEGAAHDYYKANKEDMDEGAVLNWPDMQSLEQLMMQRAESLSAFATEQQGEPIAENAPFKNLTYWVQKKTDWRYYAAIDPSLGKQGKTRDPSALLVGALDRSERSPVLYVVEALIRKRLPDMIINDAIALQSEYHCQLWFVESVQFQEFFRTELMNYAIQKGIYLPAVPINNTSDKSLRIERLQPAIAAGTIRFHATQTTLIEQLTQWPNSDHDDGPDALEMLFTNTIRYSQSTDMSQIRAVPPQAGGANDVLKGYRL